MNLRKACLILALAPVIAVSAAPAKEPGRNWEIYLIHHTHVDIGYTAPQEEVMKKQWKNLEDAMDLVDRTGDMPDDAKFRWNPEATWALESWIEKADREEQERFIRQVKDGSIGLDGLFGNMLTGLCRPAELMQALSYKHELEKMTGVDIDSAMITDVPGWSWGLVTALSQNGVRYLSLGPNRGHRIGHTLGDWGDEAFYWVSPSGKEKVLCFVHGKGYSWFHTPAALVTEVGLKNKLTPDRIFPYLEQLEKDGYPYDIIPIRYAVGSDNGPPDPGVSQVVKEWNEKYPRVKLRLSTASEALREIEKRYGKDIPEYSGDFTPYWEDGAASTARETAIARAASEKLEQAQTLWALLRAKEFPAADFHRAWNQVLLFNEHTWGAYNSITAPDSDFAVTQWEWKKQRAFDAADQADSLLGQAFAKIGPGASKGGMAYVQVFNTHSWAVSGPVTMSGRDLPGARVETADGKPVPSQVMSDGSLLFIARDVPPLSSSKYMVKEGPPYSEGSCKATEHKLENGKFSMELDPRKGTVKSIEDAKDGIEYVNNAFRDDFNQYVYIQWWLPQVGRRAKLFPDATFAVKDEGPVACSVRMERQAKKSSSLVTTVTMYDGLDRIDITNRLDRPRVRKKEGVLFAFPVLAENPAVRYDVAWGSVEVDKQQMLGACKNYITPLRWVDVSGDGAGMEIVLRDAPLFEAGAVTTDAVAYGWIRQTRHNGAIYSYVMNNYWETNYKADQPGVTSFEYSLIPHRGYDVSANMRNSREVMQPLIATPASPGFSMPAPPIAVKNENVIVESMRPLAEGGIELMIFNVSDREQSTELATGGACRELLSLEGGSPGPSVKDKRLFLAGHEMVRLVCR